MEIDKSSIIPLYYQIKEKILKDIDRGVYAPGDKLPPEMEIAGKFNVSRPTVRQAINELVFEKVLWRERGRGTFINKPVIHTNLEILTPFVEETKSQGFMPGLKILSTKVIPSAESTAEALQINPGKKVIEFTRVRLANGEPVILRTSYFSYHLLSELLNMNLEPLYPAIEKLGFQLVKSTQTLNVVTAREYEANELNVPAGFPLIMWKGTVYSSENTPVEHVKSLYRSDKYSFHVEQHRR